MQLIDKIKIFKKLNKAFFRANDFQKVLGLKNESVKKDLGRMVKKGLIKRLSRDVYVIWGQAIDSKKIASQLYAPYAYISFETALSLYGIINQIPYTVTMATYRPPKVRPFFDAEIVLRKIKKDLFFGYKLEGGMLIAEPEKALLDTLYLKSKGLAGLSEEELNLKELAKGKFLKMSKKFPLNVQKEAKRLAVRMKVG